MQGLLERIFPSEFDSEKESRQIENSRTDLNSYFLVLATLALVGLLVNFFHIEQNLKLIEIMPFAIGGFALNAFLPIRFRIPFFFSLSIAAILYIIGLKEGLILSGISIGLVLLANIPTKIIWRGLAVALAAAVLVAVRALWIPTEWGKAVMPVLGAIFMFRMLLYLYEMQYETEKVSIWKRLAYFFLLPNIVFVIFPVVDYKTFKRSFYARPAADVYKQGARWMFKGIVHLMTYRIIYYYFSPDPTELHNINDLMHYMAASYALIVRLSGIFHFSAGMICLFGFDLPETFSNYFLASSFSDLWRRINIYWKDFVMKVFYYPIYFKLKGMGPNMGMVVTILIVFAINWFLHSYQWFWIRGSFPITTPDLVFWGLFGLLIAANSLIQANSKRVRVDPNVFNWKHASIHSLKVIGMLSFMSALWSFWTSPSVSDWIGLLDAAKGTQADQIASILIVALALVALGSLFQFLLFKTKTDPDALFIKLDRQLMITNLLAFGLFLFGIPQINAQFEQATAFDTEPIMTAKLNKKDMQQLYKGYYENLMVAGNLNSQLWELEQVKPDNWEKLGSTGAAQNVNDMRLKEFKPNMDVIFKEARLTTNSLGLRDREYSLKKPPNTLRIALLGGSIEMGSGVLDDETFDNVLEDGLNQKGVFSAYSKTEVLNFAISGTHLPQHLITTETRCLEYDADVLIYTAHADEMNRIIGNLYRVISKEYDLKYDFLKQTAAKAGVTSSMTEDEFRKRMEPYKRSIADWGYTRISSVCEQNNILPVFVYLPVLDDIFIPGESEDLCTLAERKGFVSIDLSTVYNGHDAINLILAPWDKHPNKIGHELIGKRLLQEFEKNKELIRLIQNRRGNSPSS